MKKLLNMCTLFLCLVNLIYAQDNVLPVGEQKPVLHVNLDKVTFKDFLGVNAVCHGFAWMPEICERGFSEVDRQRELNRVKSMGLRIARTWYRPDWAEVGNGIAGPFDWESPKMKAFYKWLGEMKKLGVDVALQAAWGFPDDTHFGRKSADPVRDPSEYATWVSESVHQIVVNSNATEKEFTIQLSRAMDCTLQRHSYDPARVKCTEVAAIPGVDKTFRNIKKYLKDTLPAGAVAIYVTTNAPNQH